MKKNYFTKKLTSSLLAVSLSFGIAAGTLAPCLAEAFDFGSAIGALVGVGAQYAYLDQQISRLNGEGRNEYMDQVKEKYGVCDEPEANAMLDRIMTRLTDAVAKTDPSIENLPYYYFVNDQDSFNAFCTLGHNLSVNIGLFKTLNYVEDEIALAVAHELGHGQQNDPANRARKTMPLQILAALYQSQNPNAISVISANILSNLGTAKGITMPMEKKADELAFTYTANAGYNIGAGAAVWQRILEKMGDNQANFVSEIISPSDHPQHVARRDEFNDRITKYSNNAVKVNNKTGCISVKNKTIGIPAATDSMSSLERSYLVAGNLATVYHNKFNLKGAPSVYLRGNDLYLGNKIIMNITANDNGPALLDALKRANAAKLPIIEEESED